MVLPKEYLELHTDWCSKGWKSRHKTESEGGVISRAGPYPPARGRGVFRISS